MGWYTAKCLYRAETHSTIQPSGILGEYRYFLVFGEREELVREKSVQLARTKAHSYTNADGGTTRWVVEDVVDLKEILSHELAEGVEVFSEYIP
jgi:hypothetical protein